MLAGNATKTFGYGAIILTPRRMRRKQHELRAGIYQLWKDYNTDLKAITGQSPDIPMLVSQQSSVNTAPLVPRSRCGSPVSPIPAKSSAPDPSTNTNIA